VWDPLLNTDEENVQWCWLRAVEWGRWPIFLSQSVAPVLLAFLSVPTVVVLFVCLNLLWALIRYRFVSARLAEIGVFIVLPKTLVSVGMAVYLYLDHDITKAVVALLWPILIVIIGIIGIFPTVRIGLLQGKFMEALGLGDVWQARREARWEAFFREMRHVIEPVQPDLAEEPRGRSPSDLASSWEGALQGVDFEVARNALAYTVGLARDEGGQQDGEYRYQKDLADTISAFMSNPCTRTATQLLEIAPFLLPVFEGSKPGGLWTS